MKCLIFLIGFIPDMGVVSSEIPIGFAQTCLSLNALVAQTVIYKRNTIDYDCESEQS